MKSFNSSRFMKILMIYFIIFAVVSLWYQKDRLHNHTANQSLINAILHNDTAGVKAALKAGADVNAEMDGFAMTDFVHPLIALEQGDIHMHLRDTPLLLTMDSTVDRDPKAVRSGSHGIPLESLETVKTLIEAGADINGRSPIGSTALEMAVEWEYYDTAQYLLEHNANPNIADVGGMTPLHHAVAAGNVKLVKALLIRGADLNVKDILGATATFNVAFVSKTPDQAKLIRLLTKYHADLTIKDKDGHTAAEFALKYNNPGAAKFLQKYTSKPIHKN